MSDVFEVEIVARNAKDETSTKHLEYRPANAKTSAEAADELYKSLNPAAQERCREIEEDT